MDNIKKSLINLCNRRSFNQACFVFVLSVSLICLVFSVVVNYQFVAKFEGMQIVNWLKSYYWTLLRHFSHPPNIGNSWLYIGVPLILFATWLKPAIKRQKLLDRAILCDVLWMVIHALFTLTMIYVFIQALNGVLAPIFNVANLKVFTGMPILVEVMIGYMLIELLGWFNHFLRHKIPVLWMFHEVHHSQKNMNPFSLFRIHPVDYMFAEVIIFLPAMFFENTLGIVISYLAVARFQDALSHSNIKTNYGFLRYIFVTPQSHRVHHSVEKEFFDLNYGVTLCIWDRLFGTHSHSDFVYPETGIKDPDFPLETKTKWYFCIGAIIHQLIYPFKKAINTYWKG
jgi:sterol desaturase/sphingolipid hydroxylase (fatty acid hydroxylase superfamily)